MANKKYPHIDEGLKEDNLLVHYNDEKRAILIFKNDKFFLKEHPNISYLKNEKAYGKYTIDSVIISKEDKYPKNYENIKLLDEIIQTISINKNKQSPRVYEYEIFKTKRILIKSYIDYKHLKKIDITLIESLKKIHSTLLIGSSNNHKELEKMLLMKAIEDTFKEKYKKDHNHKLQIKINYNDIIDNWSELCEEYEIIKRAYIDSLDTNSIKFDYQKKLGDINDKLHSVLSDIQNKIIIPPIALILIFANVYNKNNTIKSVTMFILLFFIIIIYLYSYNQLKILSNHRKSISDWEKFYKKNLSKNHNRYKTQFENITSIADSIKMSIIIPNLFILILYVVAFAFLF